MISVIIPAYNAHATLKRALSSIAMQENIDDIETIIADDCSTEPYDHIAKEFSHMMKIKIVRMKENGGPGAARQVGYDHSSGDFVTWMDADDTFMGATSLLNLQKIMIEKDQDCVYGQFLEENEDRRLVVHEIHMVWMFGKLYRRSFIDQFNIRFNTSLSNEDTGFNCVVKGCTKRVWYEPVPVYIWHFKANSITRINDGMYGFESGYKGYIDNMIWQLKELEKRFVNKNYIIHETIAIMCNLYYMHMENMIRYPMGIDASMNWIRGYYNLQYKPYENAIDQAQINQIFTEVSKGNNLAERGIIAKMTFDEFMKEVKKASPKKKLIEEVRGSTPAGHIPVITSEDWPVEITEYYNDIEKFTIDSNTNINRMNGMKKVLSKEKENRVSNNNIPDILNKDKLVCIDYDKTLARDDNSVPNYKFADIFISDPARINRSTYASTPINSGCSTDIYEK